MPARGKRRTLIALIATAVATLPLDTPRASACCLTDWLYGRQPTYAAAPVPITTGMPYTASYTPYTASYAPSTASYTAGYTPLLTGGGTNSAYSVQRPAYGAVPLNNPSVYTGMPVATGYRGLSTPANSFYGTGNVYPNNYPSASGGVTAMRPAVGPSVSPTTGYPTPIRSGLSRFFSSLLGTGYRTSYYTAPITYYRPATSVDPITGTTVTVQQPCASTVQQLQRTPYATFQPQSVGGAFPSDGVQPCGATGCDNAMGMAYGVSPIPSTISPNAVSPSSMSPSSMSPSTINPYGGVSGYDSMGAMNGGAMNGEMMGGDYQPLAPPALPPQNYSGRPDLSTTFPPADSAFSSPGSNLSPLTGADAFPPAASGYSYPSQDSTPSASDRLPLRAPELRSARPATPQEDPNEAYRQGYEAGRAALQENQSNRQLQDNYDSYRYQPEPSGAKRPPVRSEYQLEAPENSRPSTDDSLQRSRYEIERDQRDLRDLTTQNGVGDPSWHRVRPIPAPENYRNPFTGATQPVSRGEQAKPALVPPSYQSEATDGLQAPDLLPALPRPSTQFNSGYERPSGYQNEQRLSVPVREASLQAAPKRAAVPTRTPAPVKKANDWQAQIRNQARDTGWYTPGN